MAVTDAQPPSDPDPPIRATMTGQETARRLMALREAALAISASLSLGATLKHILAELAALAGGRGYQPTARALWQQAAKIIAHITEHSGSAELSASFLRQAAVRVVLRQAEPSAITGRAS